MCYSVSWIKVNLVTRTAFSLTNGVCESLKKMLLVSNPYSIHTYNWVRDLKEQGVKADVLYVDEWINRPVSFDMDYDVEVHLLSVPSLGKLVTSNLARLKFHDILRDIYHHTRIRMTLNTIGPQIREIFNNGGYEHLHGHGVATSALLVHSSGIQPYSISAWGSDIYILPDKFPYLRPLVRDAINGAAFVHVESEISAERVTELAEQTGVPFFVSTWGVDTDFYSPVHDHLETLRKFGLDECQYFASFRALEPLYRIEYILKAFAVVNKSASIRTCLVIGSSGSQKPYLQQLAKELDIEDSVIFTGFVSDKEKRDLLRGAYAYVQFPKSDGVAITVMEAMAVGTPVISSRVGETRVLVKDGVNGMLVPSDSWEDIVHAMETLLNDTDRRTQMSLQARTIAVKYHDRRKFLKNFIKQCELQNSK